MAETLPYMNSTGLVSKILDKIKEARTPERFSLDFLGTVLGFSSGSARPFIPLAKRLTLIKSDGTLSPLYARFRGSEEESRAAMAEAVRIAYSPLYRRNEFADRLDRKKLEGLVKEVTGLEDGSSVLRAILGTFEALKQYADFDASVVGSGAEAPEEDTPADTGAGSSPQTGGGSQQGGISDLPASVRFGYTININLPDTNDITVFNAIFKSMKEHLL